MIKRTPLDAIFSDVIRESWDWTCAASGIVFSDRKGRDVHCSHFVSRINLATRWYPDNAFCLSASMHKRFSENPDEHTAFVKKILGDVRYGELIARKKKIVRYRKPDKQAMQAHYKAELERLRDMRMAGHVGYIGVLAYD